MGIPTFCGPVPPIVIAYFRTRKHCQVYCRVRHGIVVIPRFAVPPPRYRLEELRGSPHREATSGVCRDMVIQSPWTCRCRIHQLRYFQIENQLLSLNTRPKSMRSNRDSHTIGSNNEYDTPDKCIHRTLPNIHNDWQRNRIYKSCQNSREYT